MKKILLCICILVKCLISKSQSLQEILTKHAVAVGGSGIDSANPIFATGNVEMKGQNYPFTLLKVQGKLCRQEMIIEGKNYYDITIPNKGWRTYLYTNHPVEKTGDEVKSGQDDLNITDGLYRIETKKNKIELQNGEIKNNSAYYRLHSTDSSGIERDYYVDTKTFQIAKISELKSSGTKQYSDDYYFSDYRKIEGIMLPFVIDGPFGKVIFSQITINQAVDPKRYDHD